MKLVRHIALGISVTTLLCVLAFPPLARADDAWEKAWELRYQESEARQDRNQARLANRYYALKANSAARREAQRDALLRQSHAWYGNYGPYYADYNSPVDRTIAADAIVVPIPSPSRYGFSPLGCDHDPYDDCFLCDPLDPFCD